MTEHSWGNISVESNGTPEGTVVRVGDQVMEGVTSVAWKIVGPNDLPELTITVYAGKVSVVVPVEKAP